MSIVWPAFPLKIQMKMKKSGNQIRRGLSGSTNDEYNGKFPVFVIKFSHIGLSLNQEVLQL